MTEEKNKILLIGCGILKKEVRLLIEKNNWPLDTCFLDSALHVDFGQLSKALKSALITANKEYNEKNIIVFYGCCHPLMEKILEESKIFRTRGQNCVDMLLGYSLFSEELSKGAFFLLEDWAKRYDDIMTKTFGTNQEIIKEIFKEDRKYLLCLNTPCSESFMEEAENAGRKVDVPVRWMDVSLDNLESVIAEAVERVLNTRND